MPNIPMLTPSLIQPAQWSQNGKVVPASVELQMRSAINHVARWRTKELFRYSGAVQTAPTVGANTRWRFYFHTSPYVTQIRYRCLSTYAGDSTVNPTIVVSVYDTSNALVDSSTFYPGSAVGSASGNPPSIWRTGSGGITGLTADTDYYITVSETNARTMSITVQEYSLDPTIANGYLSQNVTAGQPIYDVHRSAIATMATNIWKRGAAQVLNLTADNQASPFTNATNTTKNILDSSITAVAASSPGWTLDMRYKASLARASTGVPCIMQVYGKTSAAASGSIVLKDSGGSTVATCSGFATSAAWVSSGAFNLPATQAKYDLMFTGTVAPPDPVSSTISVYAVSIYEYVA